MALKLTPAAHPHQDTQSKNNTKKDKTITKGPVLVTRSLNQLLLVRDDDNFTVNIPLMAIGNLHKNHGKNFRFMIPCIVFKYV
jgi:hypothetical protein